MTITISTDKSENIISIPNGFASLFDLNSSFYTYTVVYSADINNAIKQNAYIVNITVENDKKNSKGKPSFIKGYSGYELINNIRSMAGTTKSIGLVKDTKVVSIKSDISSRIPNNSVKMVLIQNRSGGGTKIKQFVPTYSKRLVTKSVNELNNLNFNNPVLTVNVNKPAVVDNGAINQITIQNFVSRQMTGLLFDGFIDPANLSSKKTNAVVYPNKALQGVIPKSSYVKNITLVNNLEALNVVAAQLSNGSKTNIKQQRSLSSDANITVLQNVPNDSISVKEVLKIPVGLVGINDFYITFEVTDQQGKIIQKEKAFVSHGANVSNIMPTIVPTVRCGSVNKLGRATFEIIQNDPNAKGVLIYRREINPNQPLFKSDYQLIDQVPLLAGSAPLLYRDKISTINNVIYRIVPYIKDRTPGSIFASIPIRFTRSIAAKNQPYYRRQNCGILNYHILSEGIQIEVSNYPSDALVVKFYRRDKTTNEKKWTYIKTSGLLNKSTSTSIKMLDGGVKENHDYEYKATIIYPDGGEHSLYNNLILTYKPIKRAIAKTNITNIQTVVSAGKPNITFDVNYSVLDYDFNLIKQLITSQNLLSEYEVNIIANKEKLQTLLSYSVTRINLTTGEVEEFGTIPSNKFDDLLYGASKNVKAVNLQNTYVYKVTTYVRRPETLMPNLVRTVSTTVETKPVTYQLKPYKWFQPYTLNEGNIVTDRTLATNHPENQLSQGSVVDIVSTAPISNTNVFPNITDANATQMSKNSILIEWKVGGLISDLTKIDHFIIKVSIYGMESIVGNVHNISSNNTFKFMDILRNGEQGPLLYYIVPVYYDYSQGSPAKTNEVVI